jgi:hypothetical protein
MIWGFTFRSTIYFEVIFNVVQVIDIGHFYIGICNRFLPVLKAQPFL